MTPMPPEAESVFGRGAEIDLLESFIERAGVGGEALVLVGEAGVGKTALLEVAARRAIALGVRVIRAAGAEFEADISFSALHQSLVPLLLVCGFAGRADLWAPYFAILDRLQPSVPEDLLLASLTMPDPVREARSSAATGAPSTRRARTQTALAAARAGRLALRSRPHLGGRLPRR
jgi:predicted ATPase